MNNQTLRKSPKKLEFMFLSTGIATIVLMVISILLINFLFTWAPRTEQFLTVLAVLGFPIVWFVQAAGMYMTWSNQRVVVGEDAVKVQQKRKWGSRTSTVYRYESIISAELRQSYFGAKYGYGDIILTIPKLEKDIILGNIELPTKSMEFIQHKIASLRQDTQSLIN